MALWTQARDGPLISLFAENKTRCPMMLFNANRAANFTYKLWRAIITHYRKRVNVCRLTQKSTRLASLAFGYIMSTFKTFDKALFCAIGCNLLNNTSMRMLTFKVHFSTFE